MNTVETDVLILGAGPAGSATALMLQQRNPAIKITVVDHADHQGIALGETLPPQIKALMEAIGLWEQFQAEGHLPAYRTQSVWGNDAPIENEFLFQTSAKGWRIEKRRFNRFLTEAAASRGVGLMLGATTHFLGKEAGAFQFQIESKAQETLWLQARFVVDATGRAAWFASKMGTNKVRFDNLVGTWRVYEDSTPASDGHTLVEAVENGWWYSTRLPDQKMALAYMTDSDLLEKSSLETETWDGQLDQTKYTRSRVADHGSAENAMVVPAATQCLDTLCGEGWIAVGDAACTFDPLSSQGVFKAIKSGIFGAYAVSDYLSGNQGALTRHEWMLRDAFETYLETRAKFYQQEQRWPAAEFWQRRFEWITLSPDTPLIATKAAPQKISKTRYVISEPEEAFILSLCQTYKPAHTILEEFKHSPLRYKKPRNLILGLQYLLGENRLST
ncbi:MAG: tryptophan 7-halogenase [Phycisphaerae bacterium]|nr:tryptophan 7-halogenase [Saprospiraceae bacterium]